MKKIEFFKHCIDERDIERVNGVLRSVFLTTGKEVEEFEQNFSEYIGQRYTVGNPSLEEEQVRYIVKVLKEELC